MYLSIYLSIYIYISNMPSNDTTGKAHWEANYRFSATGIYIYINKSNINLIFI
jgi:hypothetical protein